MKLLTIDFSYCDGLNMHYATQYYVDGKRVTSSSYYQADGYVHNNGYKYVSTRQWSDKNKKGVTRHYTEILFEEPETPAQSETGEA